MNLKEFHSVLSQLDTKHGKQVFAIDVKQLSDNLFEYNYNQKIKCALRFNDDESVTDIYEYKTDVAKAAKNTKFESLTAWFNKMKIKPS
jgi:hypothetical protein